ncbi:hypothetical protein FACS189434_05780 [Bacteroidia bacterium]|nr:hypothetical protein FACS189434_05780 [Bacteroidia bacterium]
MKNTIGEKGKSFNFSYATNALNITPDVERVKKYDNSPQKAKVQKRKNLLWAVLFIVPIALLIVKGHPFWAIIPAVPALLNLIWAFFTSNVTPQNIYKNGLLVGAIITNESPLQVTAVAEMQMSDDKPVCYGVKRFTLTELPEHNIRLGEKIPCAALFGTPLGFAGVYGEFEIHPASWATGDKSLINKAIEMIDDKEWAIINVLTKIVTERTDVDIDKKIAYFNENLSPRTDLYEKTEKQEVAVANPDEDFLMSDVFWAFYGGKYETLEKFAQALEEYNKSLKNQCDINEIVLELKETTIRYFYYEDDDIVEADISVSTENESGFSVAELLYKIHNQVVDSLEEDDHHFFEGLVLAEDAETGKVIYLLQQGS